MASTNRPQRRADYESMRFHLAALLEQLVKLTSELRELLRALDEIASNK